LMQQMGKSISNSVLQMATTEDYKRALFDQDKFVKSSEVGENRDLSKNRSGFRQ